MKITTILPLCVISLASPARAAGGWIDLWGFTSYTGSQYNGRMEADVPLFKDGVYHLGARARTMRIQTIPGSEQEYSASFSRELFHTTIKGRVGTAPPNSQRSSYHLAGGEAWLYFYGWQLGPENPAHAPVIWESSGPAPAPDSLDRTWVTKIGGIYTNTDHHVSQQPPGLGVVLVENTWQFELRETYKETTSVAVSGGGNQYTGRVLPNRILVTVKNNIDYAGNAFALAGWPNNWMGAEVWQKYRGWKASFAGTRLNQLDNKLDTTYGAELERELGKNLRMRLGYYHHRRRGVITREGSALGLTYLW